MKAIIDARHACSTTIVWGLTAVERICQQLMECGVTDIVILRSNDELIWKRPDLKARVSIVIVDSKPLSEIVKSLSWENTLVIDGSVIFDRRIVQYMCQQSDSAVLVDDSKLTGILKLNRKDLAPDFSCENMEKLTETMPSIPVQTLDAVDPYVASLRHRIRPEMISLKNKSNRKKAEAFLFKMSYKGGLDFIYQFVYRHFVRVLVRLLSRTHVTPNQVTLTYLAIAVTAMPFLALGYTGWGLMICLVAMIGDAADGVLARITFQTSKLGHRLDKHSHRIYHSLWYAATGYGLADGDLQSPVFWNGLVLIAIYLISRIVTGKFKDRFQISIFDITPYDRLFRYISGARWNINMLILGVGVVLDKTESAFLVMTFWGIAALLFWTSRHFTYHQPRSPR